jgi:predicted dinucleotide-binding enzyme
MTYAVLGTGSVGRAIAGKLASLDHEVVMGTRDPAVSRARTEPDAYGNQPLAAWLDDHPGVTLATHADAIAQADTVVNATSGEGSLDALGSGGPDALDGTIVIDIANPIGMDERGMHLTVVNTDSLGETIQRAFPRAHVVKTLDTVTAAVMVDPSLVGDGDSTMFVAGDDDVAKTAVTELLTTFGWRDVRDLGGIDAARGLEAYLLFWVRTWRALGTPVFNVRVVT